MLLYDDCWTFNVYGPVLDDTDITNKLLNGRRITQFSVQYSGCD